MMGKMVLMKRGWQGMIIMDGWMDGKEGRKWRDDGC